MLTLPQWIGTPTKRRILIGVTGVCLLCLIYQASTLADILSSSKHGLPKSKQPVILPPKPNLNDGKFHWENVELHYPVTSVVSLPTGRPSPMPRIQHKFTTESMAEETERLRRLDAVKEAFQHSWKGYKDRAWMADEVAPLSGASYNFFGGWAASLVDALDTLWIMDMKDEFDEAVAAIESIDFTTTEETTLNLFETTIRYLGGFLGAYDLSGGRYPSLLKKAMELGEMLLVAFDTPNHMPITRWEWRKSKDGEKQEAHTNTLVAEIGSMTLEFTRLSQITGDMRYYDAVQRITNHFDDQQMQTKLPGMWPVTVNARDIDFRSDTWYTLGAMSDSLYEYLPKQHLLLGGVTDQYRKLYERASAVFSIHNFYKPMTKDDANILFSAGVRSESATSTPVPDASMQHLVCFSGGMVALASRIFDHPSDLSTARSLTDGCIWAYKSLPHGLMSEVSHHIPCANSSGPCPWVESDWHSAVLSHDPNPPAEVPSADQSASMLRSSRLPPGYARIDDARYILRPEAIESVFILYRITGDVAYRDAAWDMFCAIENATRTAIAHAALDDILVDPPRQADRMESFWMAETLKYFYLIFTDPGVVSLDEWVFNTEAHPFRREGNGEH